MTSAMRHYKFRSCIHKNRYSSLKVGLDFVLEKRKIGIDVNSVYQCVFCKQFHIGHYPKNKIIKRNKKIIQSLLAGGQDARNVEPNLR